MEEVLMELGWVEMDEARFEAEVERVLVYGDRVEVEMKEALSA